jgi:low temperature requirement protein LtrA
MTSAEPVAKRVTWGELFFDLVFVFAITQVSHLLHDEHTWAGAGKALIVFVPIWWAWVGTSIHANTHDVDNPLDRLGIFAVGLGGLFMALALYDPYGKHSVLYGASYLAVRILLAALTLTRGVFRLSLNAFSVGLLVTGPLVLLGGFLDDGARLVVWALAGLIDLAVPALVRRRLALIHFHPEHLPERFGLFIIVALGESIVAVGQTASGADLTAARLSSVAAAFVVACGLWWVYFHFAADAVRHAVETAKIQTDIIRQVLAYGHLLFTAAIIAAAVGLAEVVRDPTHHLHLDVAALLLGGVALYLLVFGYTRWRMFREFGPSRPVAAVVVLALLGLVPFAPALLILVLVAVVLVVLNVAEAVAQRSRA